MSFAQEINNYLSFLMTSFAQVGNESSFLSFIQSNVFYFLTNLKQLALYFFSLNWFFDFIHLPITLPSEIFSSTKEIFSFSNPANFLFDYESKFLPISLQPVNFFVISFVSSIFYWFPHSSIHFLIIRRLVVEGIPAGLTSAIATLLAQFCFLFCICLGFRGVIFTGLGLESWNYWLSLIMSFILIYSLSHGSIKRIRVTDLRSLIRIFFISFFLVVLENYGLLPYFDSLTSTLSLSFLTDGWSMSFYLIGFIVGSICCILVFGSSILFFSQFCAVKITRSYSNWIQLTNFICLTFILSSAIASFPTYGLDYLVLSPFGFYSEDSGIPFTHLKTNIRDVQKGRLGEYSAHSSVDTDIAPYDRGRYATGSEVELTFEDMNFQGEYIWRSRTDRLASGSAGIVNRFMSKFLPTSTKSPQLSDSRKLDQMEAASPSLFFLNTRSNFESLLDRFLSDYNMEVRDASVPTSVLELDQFSAFSELVKYGFDSFASLEEIESDEFEEELGKKIKSKYYKNPIYKFLLSSDINQFLNRQPKYYFLTDEDEKNLWHKKMVLGNYYNSLLSYSSMPYREIFTALFGDTKSYANRLYNQQYKGTLKILRRLFLIDYVSGTNSESILKFDQLLYKDRHISSIHEEINTDSSILSVKKSKTLFESQNMPFYIGWDQNKRRLSITNRFATKTNLYESTQLNRGLVDYRFQFTSWPYQHLDTKRGVFMFHKFNNAQSDLQKDLFEYTENGEYETHLIYETLPSIIKKVDLRNKDKSLMSLKPRYGAFVWFD